MKSLIAVFVAGAVAAQFSASEAIADSPLPAPALFEPGIISGGANDGAPTFSPDGKELFFERTNSKWTIILTSRRTRTGWSEPTVAPFSGSFSDQQPALAPDGSYLVYVSTRRAASGSVASHLFRADRTKSGWSTPVELPLTVNISAKVFKPSIASNGDLYFMSDVGPGDSPRWQLFTAIRDGSGYRGATPLPFSSPTDGDVDPFVDPAGRFIIFSSNSRSDTKDGHEHLFMTNRTSAGWSPVRALRYIGDDWGADDGEAQVSPDGRTLYFTSSRVTPPPPPPRRHDAAVAAIKRMSSWDNSNSNVWTASINQKELLQPS